MFAGNEKQERADNNSRYTQQKFKVESMFEMLDWLLKICTIS